MSDALLGEMVHASRYLTGHHYQVLGGQYLSCVCVCVCVCMCTREREREIGIINDFLNHTLPPTSSYNG